MYCPNCKQEYDGNFCPECGTKLIKKPTDSGVSLNLGDANAISGGLHMEDSHNVHNEDRSVHNITNTTSTINNITHVSTQKTEMELLQERKTLYLNACKRAYEDNVLEQWEKMELDRYRMEIGLDEATADRILGQVRQLVNRNAPKTELTGLAKIKLKQLTDALKNNEVQAIMRQIDSFEALAGKFTNDELQYKYYLVLATLRHEKCIEKYENSKVDNYWKSFWTYLAYLKADNMAKAAEILYSLDDKFPNYPEDNITLLATAGSYIKNDIEAAKDYLDTVSGDYSPALQRFAETVYFLLDPELAKEMGATEQSCAFYLVNIFKQGTGTHNLVSEQTTSKETENTQVSERKQTKQETTIETTTKTAVSESSSDVILKKEKQERAKVAAEEKQRKIKTTEEVKQTVFDKLIANMVFVEGGTFTMGRTEEQGPDFYDDADPAHKVTISPFYIGCYEVTQAEWNFIMGTNFGKHTDQQCPVTNVSWEDCQTFISKLQSMTNRTFRLPTEAEWEFAARGGNESKGFRYAGSNKLDEVAWYWRNSGDKLLHGDFDSQANEKNRCRVHEVGQKQPNELGLYDMCGNVWEWCNDKYGEYKSTKQTNPKGPASGKKRILRGGSFSAEALIQVSLRNNCESNKQKSVYGFRVALDPTPTEIAQHKSKEHNQEVIRLWRKFNCPNAKWIGEGKQRVNEAPTNFELAIEEKRSEMLEEQQNCKFWQTPQFKKNGWKSIEECIAAMRNVADKHISQIRKATKRIEELTTQIETLLSSIEDKFDTGISVQEHKECERLIAEYTTLVEEMYSWFRNRPFFILMKLKDEGPK